MRVTLNRVYVVWHMEEDSGSGYSGPVLYESWEELAPHLREALDTGRQVMVQCGLLSDEELLAEREFPADVNPLLTS